ncbi:hypothetical protein FJZ39_00010 [Candidatus Saccharibacteria bacterium]|nr:hypothetical protein [Candidatus Saccharibacteria bacterium]
MHSVQVLASRVLLRTAEMMRLPEARRCQESLSIQQLRNQVDVLRRHALTILPSRRIQMMTRAHQMELLSIMSRERSVFMEGWLFCDVVLLPKPAIVYGVDCSHSASQRLGFEHRLLQSQPVLLGQRPDVMVCHGTQTERDALLSVPLPVR